MRIREKKREGKREENRWGEHSKREEGRGLRKNGKGKGRIKEQREKGQRRRDKIGEERATDESNGVEN